MVTQFLTSLVIIAFAVGTAAYVELVNIGAIYSWWLAATSRSRLVRFRLIAMSKQATTTVIGVAKLCAVSDMQFLDSRSIKTRRIRCCCA